MEKGKYMQAEEQTAISPEKNIHKNMKCEKVTLPILCSFVLLLHPLCSRLLALIISDLRAQNEDRDGQSDFENFLPHPAVKPSTIFVWYCLAI